MLFLANLDVFKILSIHQPRSDIYTLMDDVFILTKGNIAYCGPRESIFFFLTTVLLFLL